MSDADIVHALLHPIRRPIHQDAFTMLWFGSARDGAPLELVIVDDGDARVIHAMKARPKYWP